MTQHRVSRVGRRWNSRAALWVSLISGVTLLLPALMAQGNSAVAASQPGHLQPATASAPVSPMSRQLAAELGPKWWQGTDLVVTSSSDSSGMHFFVAREDEGYYWRPLASILPGGIDAGSWMGYFCVSGDDRYVLATVAPTLADNHPRLEDRGAFAYVIDIATGQVHPLVAGVAMYYDTAGCGLGDTGALASFPGSNETRTTLITANLKTATVVRRQTLPGQFTSATPASTGIAAYRGDAIVSVSPGGAVKKIAAVPGAAYDISAAAGGGLDYLTTNFGARAQAWHLPQGARARPEELATGQRTRLRLFSGAAGRNVVLGATASLRAVNRGATRVLAVHATPLAMSRQGNVIETDTAGRKGAARFTPVPNLVTISTGQELARTLPAAAPPSVSLPAAVVNAARSASGRVSPQANTTTPVCAVPRLNPQRQVMQPSGHQVEWAVDEAVRGDLTVSRAADFDNMGLPAYSPQGDLPTPALVGGGTTPPQVMMGILAQESNFDQASWHALPGYAGDPLIADYYGDGGGIDTIDYDNADCGYGIGQITTGMTAGSTYWGSAAMQEKIAVDFAENVQASVSLLAQKWNQLASYSPAVLANGGNPSYVENWYLAIWAYNTGLDPNSSTGNTTGCTPGPSCTDAAGNGPGGNWGLGWTNNPLDTDWNPGREPFLSSTYADAANPGQWPYQEKVLGWAAVPLLDYTGTPSYTPVSGYPAIAPFATFCTSADHCNPSSTPTCSLGNFHCWWHAPVSWASCSATTCQTGIFSYAAGAGEPTVTDPYPPDCNSTLPSSAYITDDEPTDYNLVGCASVNWKSTGTFALTQGTNSAETPISLIDTHQVGTGFGGHVFFTHNYAASDAEHLVTGTWKVNLPTQAYHVLVHIPSSGGTTTSAHYKVTAANGTVYDNVVDQYLQQNQWVGIGYYSMGSNAQVTLNNVTDDGALGVHDVGFDAVAFVPVSGTAVNHTFDAVSLFDWNQNLDTALPTEVDTPARTEQTLHDWAVDYSYKGPEWSNPAYYIDGISSYPKCSSLSTITSSCVPADVWNVGNTWYTAATEAGSAPSTSSTPTMTEPEWLSFANPTPAPATMTPATFSDDADYKIKTHINISFIVSGGKIVPGSDQVNTEVRTGSTTIPAFVLNFMKAVQADYGIAPPTLAYDEMDANSYSGDATAVNPYATGLAPGRQYDWHSDPSSIVDSGTCVAAHTITGGTIGYRPMVAQTPVAASVTAWQDAIISHPGMNASVSAMAEQVNEFFFSQETAGGTLFLRAPPIWQDAHIDVCANGKVTPDNNQWADSDDNPVITLVNQSYMPDLYLYFDNKLVTQSGGAATGPVQKGNFVDFSNLPGSGNNPFNTCETDTLGNGGNPWGLSVTAAPDARPAAGIYCDDWETFGNPFPGG